MVTKLHDVKFENVSSVNEMVHPMELGQEAKKSEETLHCEKKSEVKSKAVEDKFDTYELIKLLLEDF